MVGAFRNDTVHRTQGRISDGVYEDNISRLGFSENSVDEKKLLSLRLPELDLNFANNRPIARVFNGNLSSFEKVYDYVVSMEGNADPYAYTNHYLATNIYSSTDQDVALLIATTGGIKLWLNKQLIVSYRSGDQYDYPTRYKAFQRVRLKTGNNFLFLKETKQDNSYISLKVDVVSLKAAQKILHDQHCESFISNPCISNGGKIILKYNFQNFYGKSGLLQLVDAKKRVCFSTTVGDNKPINLPIELSSRPGGVYKCKVIIGDTQYEETVFLGDLQKGFEMFKQVAAQKYLNEKEQINLEPLLKRFNMLLEPLHRPVDTVEIERWQKKITFVAAEIAYILDGPPDATIKFRYLTGTHLRGFTSKIDRAAQFYSIYVPKSILKNNSPAPVALLINPIPENHYPFFMAPHMAYLETAQNLQLAADRSEMIIVLPSARLYGNEDINPVVETGIFETIAAIQQDYHIDTSRIFLIGTCSGARRCLAIACHYPSYFAGVAMCGGVFGTSFKTPWQQRNSPESLYENLFNMPIYVQHDPLDDHTSIKQIQSFLAVGREASLAITSDFEEGSRYAYLKYDDFVKPACFLARCERIIFPRKVKFVSYQKKYNTSYWIRLNEISPGIKNRIEADFDPQANRFDVFTEGVTSFTLLLDKVNYTNGKLFIVKVNGNILYSGIPDSREITILVKHANTGLEKRSKSIEGPIIDFFSDRFLLVKPTIAEGVDDKTPEEFASIWKSYYYSNLKIIKDSELSHEQIMQNNILLFGNDRTNSVLKKIASRMIFHTDSSSVTVGGKKFEGRNLNFQFISPNPLNPARYIFAMGNNWSNFKFLGVLPFVDGYYDLEVWSGNPHLTEEPTRLMFDKGWW